MSEAAQVTGPSGGQPAALVAAPPGLWAAAQFDAAMERGDPLSSATLKANSTLREEEWEFLEDALVEEGQLRLQGIQDLINANLTVPIPNALGKTEFSFEDVTDMSSAEESLSGIARSVLDRQEFNKRTVPLPIVHKDFNLFRRQLEASRERGETLDTTGIRNATRRVIELMESILFTGGGTYGGNRVHGYTTHGSRNTGSFSNGHWDDGASGSDILADVRTMKAGLQSDRYYGPYALYIPSNFDSILDAEYSSNYPRTIRNRLEAVDGLSVIRTVDQLTADNVVMVQLTSDVIELADGMAPDAVQWDLSGGFQINFKVWAIQIPIIKRTAAGRSGIYHMS